MINTNNREKQITTKIPPIEHEKINQLVEDGIYISSSDFVQEAIRDKLGDIEVINVRNIGYEKAKKEVLGYYQANESSYMSDVVSDLELDLQLVVNITEELIKEKRLKPLN